MRFTSVPGLAVPGAFTPGVPYAPLSLAVPPRTVVTITPAGANAAQVSIAGSPGVSVTVPFGPGAVPGLAVPGLMVPGLVGMATLSFPTGTVFATVTPAGANAAAVSITQG